VHVRNLLRAPTTVRRGRVAKDETVWALRQEYAVLRRQQREQNVEADALSPSRHHDHRA
jgi:hypothetical protein